MMETLLGNEADNVKKGKIKGRGSRGKGSGGDGGSTEEGVVVPKWLVEQQAKKSRDDGGKGGASGGKSGSGGDSSASGGGGHHHKGKSKSEKGDSGKMGGGGGGGGGKKRELKRKMSGVEDDVFVMVDLLDASHLPSSTSLSKTKAGTLATDTGRNGGKGGGVSGGEEGMEKKLKERHLRGDLVGIDVDETSREAHQVAASWKRNPGDDSSEDSMIKSEEVLKRVVDGDGGGGGKGMGRRGSQVFLDGDGSFRRRGSGEFGKDDGEKGGIVGGVPLLSAAVNQIGKVVQNVFRRHDSSQDMSEQTYLLGTHNNRKGNGSMIDTDDQNDNNDNNNNNGRSSRGRDHDVVYPSAWEWRKPADEDVVVPQGAWLYLAMIGWLTFVLCYSVTITSHVLIVFLRKFSSFITETFGNIFGFLTLSSFRVIFAISAFAIVQKISPKYANGSGIPEMKCVLSGVYMPKALSARTLMAKLIGLTFALASGLSIGKLGPFMHISGMIAAIISRSAWFSTLRTSARCQLQAVSVAMAAGVGATFGAPIGATLLSIELMSTYYYIHWLPIALYCVVMGYIPVVAFSKYENLAYFYSSFEDNINEHEIARVFIYSVLGIVCGVVGAMLVQYTGKMFMTRKKYASDKSFERNLILMAGFTLVHTVITSMCGGILDKGQKTGVLYLFNNPVAHTEKYTALPIGVPEYMYSSLTLVVAIVVKFLLTGISLVLPIPAGTFIPIFELGALFGRLFGDVIKLLLPLPWLDPRATAVVGAAAMTAGTLHITSIAVIMLELTMDAVNVLPLLFSVVISYAVSKHICSDLFSELIKLRKLPFILGLRERYPRETRRFYKAVSTVTASSFMSTDFPYVTPESTKGEVRQLLSSSHWSTCAFLSSKEERKLIGTISRNALVHAVLAPSTLSMARARDLEKGEGDGGGQLERRKELSTTSSFAMASPTTTSSSASAGPTTEYGSTSTGAMQALNDQELVPFLANFDVDRGHRNVDMGPMIVAAFTPFWKVTTYFTMLGMSKMYVIDDGLCVGCLTKAHIIRSTFEIEEKARRDENMGSRERRREGGMSRRASAANFANFDKIIHRRTASINR